MPNTQHVDLADLCQELPQFLTLAEVAKLLRISPLTAWRHTRDGTFPSLKVGQRVLVPSKALFETLAVTGAPKGRRRGRR